MNFLFLTDTHFRNESPIHRTDNIFETQLEKLRWILEFAKKNNAQIIHGGDMFHKPSPPDIVGNRVAQLFDEFGIDVYYILGNHDVTGSNSDSFDYGLIGMFRYYKWFHFLHDKYLETDDCYVFGFDFSKETECADYISYEEIIDPNNMINRKRIIQVVHNMIVDEPSVVINGKYKTICWKEVTSTSDIVLCGHFHPGIGIKENTLDVQFVNPGAMVRLEASDIEVNREPKVALIKIEKEIKIELVIIPHRKDVFDVKKVEFEKSKDKENSAFIGALESIRDEDVMSGNIMNILDKLNPSSLSEELREIITEKTINRCKKKIKEITDG